MKISPTPWRVYHSATGDMFIAAADGSYVAEMGCPDGELTEADARYLVAAVNAAAGTSVEQLEDPDA